MSAGSSSVPTKSVKEGQTVKFIPRDAATEPRLIPYYDFYSNLSGTVAKLYDDGTVAVIIDRSTLPDDARDRHEKSERDMRDKWMRSLSEDDRGKLTDAQKQFALRYTLLTNATDLIDISDPMPPVVVKESRKEAKTVTLTEAAAAGARPSDDTIAEAEAGQLETLLERAADG